MPLLLSRVPERADIAESLDCSDNRRVNCGPFIDLARNARVLGVVGDGEIEFEANPDACSLSCQALGLLVMRICWRELHNVSASL